MSPEWNPVADIAVLAVAISLAAILGLSAHKAGICMVRAVAEVMTSGRPFLLLALAKVAAWSFLAILAGRLVGGGTTFAYWPAAWPEVAGGIVFGVGAAVNGSCVFSTLTRLADGKVGLLAAVAMWPVGVLAARACFVEQDVANMQQQVHSIEVTQEVSWIVTVGLAVWAVSEVRRIGTRFWKSRNVARMGTGPLSLSSGAALIGLSNGYLYYHFGNWSFTSAVTRSIFGADVGAAGTVHVTWLLLISAVLGMFISSRLRGSQEWTLPRLQEVMRHAAGGLAMGLGSALIPGGNDALILFGIPSLSPHAIPATLGILVGAALGLALRRATGGRLPTVDCSSDVCRSI
jgi:uncharacterized protein